MSEENYLADRDKWVSKTIEKYKIDRQLAEQIYEDLADQIETGVELGLGIIIRERQDERRRLIKQILDIIEKLRI